ncbi:flagellar FliJ protein [Alteromonadaceae bacterium Bs31]|nr:flagellar FliJ protein [Alteromonadaceae bacterium Bs31]
MSLPSKRIQIVIDLARRKLDAAATELQLKQQALKQERDKLGDLSDYYQHYSELFANKVMGVRARDVANSRLFLQQMTQAIKAQEQQLLFAEKTVVTAQQLWHGCYLKVQSLIDLQQRYVTEEQHDLEKKEQRLVEEWLTSRQPRQG